MMTVPLSGKRAAGRVALVDDEDAALVAGHSWWASPGKLGGFYAVAHIPGSGHYGRKIYMHQLITGRRGIDHRNANGLDNRRANLRVASESQNQANARKHSREGGTFSAFKGVSLSHAGNWRAYIWRDGAQRNLGSFASEVDAARAYDAAALALHGEYARLNFPA